MYWISKQLGKKIISFSFFLQNTQQFKNSPQNKNNCQKALKVMVARPNHVHSNSDKSAKNSKMYVIIFAIR